MNFFVCMFSHIYHSQKVYPNHESSGEWPNWISMQNFCHNVHMQRLFHLQNAVFSNASRSEIVCNFINFLANRDFYVYFLSLIFFHAVAIFSRKIRLCVVNLEGNFQTNLQIKLLNFLVSKFESIIPYFYLFFAENPF